MTVESTLCGPYSLSPFQNGSVSLCFLDVIWTSASFLFLFSFGLWRGISLVSASVVRIEVGKGQWTRMIGFGASCFFTLLRSSFGLLQSSSLSIHSLFSDFLNTLSWLFAVWLTELEYSRGMKTSWILRLWITCVFIGEALRFSSAFQLRHSPLVGSFYLFFSVLVVISSMICNVVVLYFNHLPSFYSSLSSPPSSPLLHHDRQEEEEGEEERGVEEEERKECPLEEANFFSKISFSWMNSIMALGYKRPLMMRDLYQIPQAMNPQHLDRRFEEIWKEEMKKINPSLFSAFWRCYRWELIRVGGLKWMNDFLIFSGPFFLNLLVQFVSSNSPKLSTGLFLVLGFFFSGALQVILLQQFWFKALSTAKKIEANGIDCIYKKTLCLSSKSRAKQSVGEITNLQTVDMSRINTWVFEVYSIPTAIIQITIAMILLWNQLGASSLGGIVVLVVCCPINALITKKLSQVQEQVMQVKDARTKQMAEILNGIRIIKFFTWEDSYSSSISNLRKEEVECLRKSVLIRSFGDLFWTASPVFVSASTFTLYALTGNILTASKAFTSLALFNIIRHPLTALPYVIYKSIEARVSFKRLNLFFAAEELNPKDILRSSPSSSLPSLNSFAIQVEKASWQWNEEGFKMENISFNIGKGKLVGIVGGVGSGKSTLLYGLLGEAPKKGGKVEMEGGVGYVAQQAWIKNATLKENILFGSTFDAKRYKRCIQVCELESDLKMLASGDSTEIGEKGINLSGGQKQRVSLARALYQNRDIVIMDDCLSAVDAHVGKNIFEKCILGEMKGKTRILVTHQLQYLSSVDLVIVLKDGIITEQGTYQELMNKIDGSFRNLIQTHVQKKEEPAQTIQTSESLKKSMETLRQSQTDQNQDEKEGEIVKLIEEEERNTGTVGWNIYKTYFRSTGGLFVVLTVLFLFSAELASRLSSDFWMSNWSTKSDLEQENVKYYLGIYSGLALGGAVLSLFSLFAIKYLALNASRSLHDSMLNRIMRAPMAFFDTTPLGRILNRFSKDINAIDDNIPESLSWLLLLLFALIGVLIVIVTINPTLAIFFIPGGWVYHFAQKYFISSSREIQRLTSLSRSPIISHFVETLQGISTIRAFERKKEFSDHNQNNLKQNIQSYFCWIGGNRWLGTRLEFLGTLLMTLTALGCVTNAGNISAGAVGLALAYTLQSTEILNWLVRSSTDTENYMISVERINEYSHVDQEAPSEIPSMSPPNHWPSKGVIEFKGIQLRYRPGLDLVLKGISLKIQSKEKIGVVGRTGAGKSSLMLALFRLVELSEGSILIDGIDISLIGLKDLRSKLSIIPQDPTLFTGTIRSNLDPFEMYSDSQIWTILESIQMKETIQNLPGKLVTDVTEGGENFSVGQRQLICLGRALLKQAKILILDEATAAVDFETDSLIQRTIREGFKDATVLTIAHRINTILDYDRVLVLDFGLVAEFDSPENLLKKPGIFASLVEKSHK